MERRHALQYVGALIGSTFISTELFLTGCKTDSKSDIAVNESQVLNFEGHKSLLTSIGETILPKGGIHPGFAATGASVAIVKLLNECYKPEDQKKVEDGLAMFGDFEKGDDTIKKAKIQELEDAYFGNNADKSSFYGILKEATLLSYFADEMVITKVFNYVKVPGKYDGEMKIADGSYNEAFGFGIN